MTNPANSRIMNEYSGELYSYICVVGLLFNLVFSGLQSYNSIKEARIEAAKKRIYVEKNKVAMQKLKANKHSSKLKKNLQNSELVLEIFRIRDFKRLLDANGIETMPIIGEHMVAFKANKHTKKLLMGKQKIRRQEEKEEEHKTLSR